MEWMKSTGLLALCIAPVMVWSAWCPYDRLTWWLEVAPVFLALVAMGIAEKRTGWRFSGFALLCIFLHMVVLAVGGHYTYARVPVGDWASGWFGWERNHYDRLGHIMQGFVPAVVCREIFLRTGVLARRGWLGFCVTSFCLGFSALYELIEWAAALISAEAAESFLGTQGDGWDTQWDMFLALCGALGALMFASRLHDRAIRKLPVASVARVWPK
jgi:putative membrane protein